MNGFHRNDVTGDADGNSYRGRTIPCETRHTFWQSLELSSEFPSDDETDGNLHDVPGHAKEYDEDPHFTQNELHDPSSHLHDESTADDNLHDSTRKLLRQAYEYMQPNLLFRFCIRLYADRKMLVIAGMHLVATLTVWGKSNDHERVERRPRNALRF